MNNFSQELYKKYTSQLFKFILSKAPSHEDAEEILQDTWMSIYDSLPMFKGKASFLTWAKAIASHEVCDFYRKRKLKTFVFSHLPFVGHLVSQALGPDLEYEKQELREDIEKILKKLSEAPHRTVQGEGYSQILRLKYIEEYSMVTIAQLLKLTTKAVESRLFRARLAFQKAWCETYQNEPLKFSSLSLLKRAI